VNRLAALLLVVAGSTPLVAQSRAPEPSAPNMRKLVTFDSGHVGIPVLSPNGRWVAFDAGGSIWMAPTDGQGRPVRITSSGYKDFLPFWFPAGNALTFMSNRASRNGGSKFYGMTIAIDPNTGRAAGPPRAVTTDEVSVMGFPSRDGKLIAYVTALRDSIKVVPSTGGTARFVAEVADPSPPRWHPDDKSLVFSSPWHGPNSNWYRVAVTGGTPERTEHAPFLGSLHVHRDRERTPRHLELRDSTERVVSTLDVPAGMNDFAFDYAPAALGVMNAEHYVSHIYSVETEAHRVIDNWADGWTSDGKNFVVELVGTGSNGSAIGSIAIGVQDPSGRIVSRVALPADASGCCGWSGVVGTAVTFMRRSSKALFIADAQSGRVRELAPEPFVAEGWSFNVSGRGGQGSSDGGRFLYSTLTEHALEVRAADSNGNSTLLRAYSTKDSTWQPKNLNGGHAIAILGDRIAWTDRAGLDHGLDRAWSRRHTSPRRCVGESGMLEPHPTEPVSHGARVVGARRCARPRDDGQSAAGRRAPRARRRLARRLSDDPAAGRA